MGCVILLWHSLSLSYNYFEIDNVQRILPHLIMTHDMRIKCSFFFNIILYLPVQLQRSSRKHRLTKVTPDLHLTYSNNGDICGRNQNGKN